MTQSYRLTSGVCNTVAVPTPAVALSTRLQSFFRWLCKLSQEHGFCWASTGYLAKTQRATERTVYRWLSKLRGAGFIEHEVDTGIERRITPLRKPESIRGTPHRFIQTHNQSAPNVRGKQGKLVRGFVRGLPLELYTQETTTGQSCTLAGESCAGGEPGANVATVGSEERGEFQQNTTSDTKTNVSRRCRHRSGERATIPSMPKHLSNCPRSPLPSRSELLPVAPVVVWNEKEPLIDAPSAAVVAALVGAGVSEAVAVLLVGKHGVDAVQVQLDALVHRKPKDPAAVLVSSIRSAWKIPGAFVETITRKTSDAAKQQTAALSAALERKRQDTAAMGLAAFSGQSDAIRDYWRECAGVVLRQEYGTFAHMTQKRAFWSDLVERRAVALWSASSGGS